MSAGEGKLTEIQGIGSEGALFLNLFNDLSLRFLRSSHTNETLNTKDELCRCFISQLGDSESKLCHFLCLGAGAELHRHISVPSDELLGSRVTQKELAEMFFRSGAISIAACTGHGSGMPVPSDEDYAIAKLLGELLSALGIDFRDFVVCGSGKAFSMRSSGAFAF